jgi:hypothetical protein
MAANENQPQPVILDVFLTLGIRELLRFGMKDQVLLRGVGARSPAHRVNGFEAGRRNQPGPRIFGNAALLPYVQRRRKGLLHGVLGEIKVPEQAYQTR